MMCCKKCPFNPVSGYAEERCPKPVCEVSVETLESCKTIYCSQNLGARCFMDYYVINNLRNSKLAEQLVLSSLKSALIGRDRALLIALFYAADRTIQEVLWKWLNANVPRSLWLLNPLFVASGLSALENFDTSFDMRSRYLDAIISRESSVNLCRSVQNNLMVRRLRNEMQ